MLQELLPTYLSSFLQVLLSMVALFPFSHFQISEDTVIIYFSCLSWTNLPEFKVMVVGLVLDHFLVFTMKSNYQARIMKWEKRMSWEVSLSMQIAK